MTKEYEIVRYYPSYKKEYAKVCSSGTYDIMHEEWLAFIENSKETYKKLAECSDGMEHLHNLPICCEVPEEVFKNIVANWESVYGNATKVVSAEKPVIVVENLETESLVAYVYHATRQGENGSVNILQEIIELRLSK